MPITDKAKPKHGDICLVIVYENEYRTKPRIEIASAQWSCSAQEFLYKPEWAESVTHWAHMPNLGE